MSAPPFIVPASLDDADLNVWEFRVLAHLRRRAGSKTRCWPSVLGIARNCGISKPTVLKQLKSLEQLGAIVRHKSAGALSQIEVTPLESWIHKSRQRHLPVNGADRSTALTGTGQRRLPKGDTRRVYTPHTENGAGGGQVLEKPKLPAQSPTVTAASQPQSSGPSERKTDPRHHPFVEGYTDAFRKRVGAAYVCQPRDFKSLSQLLKAAPALTLEHFLRLFRSARDAAEGSFATWVVKQSASLHGLCAHFSEIQAALARPPPRLYPARPEPVTLY